MPDFFSTFFTLLISDQHRCYHPLICSALPLFTDVYIEWKSMRIDDELNAAHTMAQNQASRS